MSQHLTLPLLCLLVAGATAEPAPGRVPKVYNALITSNQNLEPSKAYPVYQPVLHDTAFAYPFQPAVFYGGEFPVNNGILPGLPLPPKGVGQPPAAENPTEVKPSSEAPPSPPPPSTPEPQGDEKPTATDAPPLPPNTQSPIPLNEFGLPAQVLPLGRFDPAFNGFTQVGPFTYSYPGLRYYDPYDPFGFNPYYNLPPLYRPLGNVLSQGVPAVAIRDVPAPSPSVPAEQAAPQESSQSPPSEPSDLNVLNYSSKDPAIPNVPPPPLPQGGLKSDNSE